MSRTLHFLHGSSHTTDHPEDFAFSLFNYRYDTNTGKADHTHVNSGLDAAGPGVYALGVEKGEAFDFEQVAAARSYSGKNGQGSMIGFSVELEGYDEDEPVLLANENAPDWVSQEEWTAVVEAMVVKIREYKGFDEDGIDSAIQDIVLRAEDGETLHDDDVLAALAPYVPDLEISYMYPDEYEDIGAWEDAIRESIELYDPAGFIYEEGGPEHIAGRALEQDSLWDALTFVFNRAGCSNNGGVGVDSYNAFFLEAVRENVDDMDALKVAEVGGFYVVFDVTAPEIEMIEQRRANMDEPRFAKLCADVIECGQIYSYDLEPEQLDRKLNALAVEAFGAPFSDDTLNNLRLVRSEKGLYSGLQEKMRHDLAGMTMDVWERTPGCASKFEAKPIDEPVLDEPVAQRAMSMR